MDIELTDDAWTHRRIMTIMSGLVDEAWTVIEPNLECLTDAEYFWEPAADCWTVRRRDQARSPDCWGKGDWVVEHSFDGSQAPTMTTIGWRLRRWKIPAGRCSTRHSWNGSATALRSACCVRPTDIANSGLAWTTNRTQTTELATALG
jgi:hypothetical protein